MSRCLSNKKRKCNVLHQIKHEFKRHLINIFDLSQHASLDEIQNYCQNLFGEIEIDERGLQLLDFHNFTVSNIYMRFLANCRESEINLDRRIQFCDFSFIRDIDAAALFNNLFTNAIDACNEMPSEKKISLVISQVQNNVIVKLSNSMCHPIKEDSGKLLSSKRNYKAPGVGVEKMISIAEMYGGYVSYTFSTTEFETIIRLALPKNAT